MFREMLSQIREAHPDIEFILLTGDYPPHDIWTQTEETNLAHAKAVVDNIIDVFGNIPVLPCLGNHEPCPANNVPTSNMTDPEHTISDYYEELAIYYEPFFLPRPGGTEALEKFKGDGFYSMEIVPGLRAIGMNSMWQYTANFWLNHEWIDPAGQLDWLTAELLDAEAAGERVYIVSHVPGGFGDTMGGWGRELDKIVSRFENTVVAQFYGHTHQDEFIVFYGPDASARATNIAFISPSVATWTNLNPSYRIFTSDANTHRITDIDTYILDLEAANSAHPSEAPNFTNKLYNTREALGMEDLFPASWDQLVRRMYDDDELYDEWSNYWGSAAGRKPADKNAKLCQLVSPSTLDQRKCEEIVGTTTTTETTSSSQSTTPTATDVPPTTTAMGNGVGRPSAQILMSSLFLASTLSVVCQ